MNLKKLTNGRRVRDNRISDRVYDKYFIVCVTDYATYDESLIKESDLETIGHGLYTWAGLKGYINKIIKGTGLNTEFKIDKSSYTYSCYFVDANGKHKAYIGFGILETPDADLLNTLQNMNVPSISDSRKVKDGFYQDWGVNGYNMDNYPYYKVLINGDSQGIVCDNEDEAIEYAQKVDKRFVSKRVNIEVRLYTAEFPVGELVWSNNISDSVRRVEDNWYDEYDDNEEGDDEEFEYHVSIFDSAKMSKEEGRKYAEELCALLSNKRYKNGGNWCETDWTEPMDRIAATDTVAVWGYCYADEIETVFEAIEMWTNDWANEYGFELRITPVPID